jgi:hypothetical protein
MTRYIRSQLKRLSERIGQPESPDTSEVRARMVQHLDAIAQARRDGTWTDEDAARSSEAVRAEAEKRRLVGGRLHRY